MNSSCSWSLLAHICGLINATSRRSTAAAAAAAAVQLPWRATMPSPSSFVCFMSVSSLLPGTSGGVTSLRACSGVRQILHCQFVSIRPRRMEALKHESLCISVVRRHSLSMSMVACHHESRCGGVDELPSEHCHRQPLNPTSSLMSYYVDGHLRIDAWTLSWVMLNTLVTFAADCSDNGRT